MKLLKTGGEWQEPSLTMEGELTVMCDWESKTFDENEVVVDFQKTKADCFYPSARVCGEKQGGGAST